jgi:hypothetical protein
MPGVEPGVPWGEVVPNAPYPMTVQDFQRWRGVAESYYCELVSGHLIQTPWQGMGAGLAAMNLAARLLFAVKSQKRGYAVTGSYFHLPFVRESAPTVLRASLAYISPEHTPPTDAVSAWVNIWRIAPDLIAEIAASPQQAAMGAKAQVWLSAGCRLVWVIWQRGRLVEVWRPGDTERPSQIMRLGETLDGCDVLPGLRLPVADLV